MIAAEKLSLAVRSLRTRNGQAPWLGILGLSALLLTLAFAIPLNGRTHADWLQEDRDRKQRLAWLKRGRSATRVPPMPPPSPGRRSVPATHAGKLLNHEQSQRQHHGR